MQPDPNVVLLEFLESLPSTIRDTFYFVMGGFLSGLQPIDTDVENLLSPEPTKKRVRDLLSDEPGHGLVGSVLAIVAVIDFQLRTMRDANPPPALIADIEKSVGSLELARRHTANAWQDWCALRSAKLSDKAITEFFLHATLSPPTE